MKKKNISIPVITGAAAAIIAIIILFNPFGGDDGADIGDETLLFSAEDAAKEIAGDEEAGGQLEGETVGEISADNGNAGSENTNIRNKSSAGRSTGARQVKLERRWKKKFDKPVTSSPATNGTGIIFGCRDGNLYSFSPEGEMKWKYNMRAGVGSSPVVIPGDRVICADYQGDVVCLNAVSGESVWSVPLNGKVISTPDFEGNLLFVGTMEGNLHCLNMEIGEEVWKRKLGEGIWSSIRAYKDYVITATTDGDLKKLDHEGETIWSETAGRDIYSTPLCIPEENIVLVGSSQGLISTFTLSDGALRWQYKVSDEVRSTPSVQGDYIVMGTDDGKVYCFNLEGRMRWMQDIGEAVRSEPLIIDGIVYITAYNSRLNAIQLSTGNMVGKYDVESNVYSSPLYYNGSIFFGTMAGYLHSAELLSE